ncbi:MipA/OmpV family protein [Acidovorax lacteus]|uniref:MipA/OmpV family protein n=1 Tax=Acidovorax lacteus TaxID=1924988 RepID=A0ABP8LAW1_9BURK
MRSFHQTIRIHAPLARTAATAAVAACAVLVPGWASAQAFDAVRLYGAAPDQNGGTIGLAVVAGREYAGSDERRTRLLPAIDYRWANGWFAGTTNGIGYNFSRDPALQYGLRLTADFGRDEDRSRVLRGLGDVEARPELGAFFNLLPSRNTFVTTSLRYGSGNGRDGLLFDVGAGMAWQPAPAWRLGAGVAATWANAAYQQSYFGVDAAQAARSGLARTSMGSGVRDVRASVSATYSFHPKAAVTAALSYSRLQGDAARSPIVREAGSLGGVVAVSYRF